MTEDGYDGRDGSDGRDGAQGRDGRDGRDGRGARGGRGRRGRRGRPAGRGVSLVRLLVATVVVFALLHAYYAHDDDSGPVANPSAACVPAAGAGDVIPVVGLPDVPTPWEYFGGYLVRQPKRAVEGLANRAGNVVHRLATTPPSVESVTETWEGIFGFVGDVSGGFVRGVRGVVDDGPGAPRDEGGAPAPGLPSPKQDDEDGGWGGRLWPPKPMMPRLPISACSPCPTALSGAGAALAAEAGYAAGWRGEDLVVAVAVAGAESSWDPEAKNSTSTARGLWQTMMSLHQAKFDAIGGSWWVPGDNARVAHRIWSEAGGWRPWVAHTSGAYRAYLPEARAAVNALTTAPPPQAVPVAADTSLGLQPSATLGASYARSLGFAGTIGGYGLRGNETWHDDGLAIDLMTTDRAEGDRLAATFQAQAEALGVRTVIWRQRIWTQERAGEGWRPMEDRGSVTANHFDHVHVDFYTEGGSCAPVGGGVVAVGVGA